MIRRGMDIIGTIIQSFGPIAFGLISILILWWRIVEPALERARNDTATMTRELREVASAIHAASNINRDLALSIERTAERLNQTATILTDIIASQMNEKQRQPQ